MRHPPPCGALTPRVCYVRPARTQGPKAASDFSNSWGIGIAISQASDASGLLTATLQAALVVTILEVLWLVTNAHWLEDYIDFVSIHATVASTRSSRVLDLLSAHKRFSYAVA